MGCGHDVGAVVGPEEGPTPGTNTEGAPSFSSLACVDGCTRRDLFDVVAPFVRLRLLAVQDALGGCKDIGTSERSTRGGLEVVGVGFDWLGVAGVLTASDHMQRVDSDLRRFLGRRSVEKRSWHNMET